MFTVPTFKPAMYFCIRRKSLVQTPDDKLKAVEFDSAMSASSSSGARMIGMMGAERFFHDQLGRVGNPIEHNRRQKRTAAAWVIKHLSTCSAAI